MTTKYSCSLAKVSGVNMASQFHTTGICAHWWLRCPEAVAHQLSLCKPPSGHQCLPRCVCFSPVKRCVSQKEYPHIYIHTHTYPQQQETDNHGDVPSHKYTHIHTHTFSNTSSTNLQLSTHLGKHTSLGQPPPSVLSLDYPANRKCSLNVLFLFMFGCGITSLFKLVK